MKYTGSRDHNISHLCNMTSRRFAVTFFAGTWETQFGSPFEVTFGGFMINTGQSISDICQSARALGYWVNTLG
jgi:hypothetical protein